MQRWLRHIVPCAVFSLGFASTAAASSASEFHYPHAQLWSAAVRLLRVDFGYTIKESDASTGFILFEYTHSAKQVSGSLEMIRLDTAELPTTRVVAKLPSMPTYLERYILDRLRRKLQEDFGEANRPRPSAPSGEGAGPTETAPQTGTPPDKQSAFERPTKR